MLNFFRKIGGKQQVTKILLLIKADLKNYETVSIVEKQQLSWGDQQLLQAIRLKTKQLNVNNITRTKAYLDFYIFRPEIHWAFFSVFARMCEWLVISCEQKLTIQNQIELVYKLNF